MVAEDDPLFVQFWERFPRRVAKKDARIAWAAVNPSAEMVARMVMTLTWQTTSADWLRDGGRYVPYPASWIRAERWTDESPTPPPPKALSAAVSDPMQAWLAHKGVSE